MPFLIAPWKHQLRGMDLAAGQRDFAFFFEQGTGKTSTAINMLRWQCLKAKRPLRTLVLGPKVIVQNWVREFQAHSKLAPQVVPLVGTGAKRLKTFQESKAAIFVTNYEAMMMPPLYNALVAWRPEIVICDESQRLKSWSSKRAKRVALLADPADHRYILSGTPILRDLMDIFQQYRVLDGGATFGKNFYSFRAQYFDDKNAGMPKSSYFPNWQPRANTVTELNRLIYKKAMRVTKDECLDLPPLVRTEVPVDMGPAQRKAYEEMKKNFITFLGDAACTAQLAVTKALRLQQIVSGFAVLEDETHPGLRGATVDFTHGLENPRAQALSELLEDLAPAHKVIVWAVFKQNYVVIRRICEALKLNYVELTGETPDKLRQMQIDAFQSDPSVRVMLANPGAGGIGVNLTAASYSIFYSRSFSLEHDLQAEARNHRGGSEVHDKITRIDLVTLQTIDEQVLKALAAKQNIADQILTWRDKI